jgi:hypothetical protein
LKEGGEGEDRGRRRGRGWLLAVERWRKKKKKRGGGGGGKFFVFEQARESVLA